MWPFCWISVPNNSIIMSELFVERKIGSVKIILKNLCYTTWLTFFVGFFIFVFVVDFSFLLPYLLCLFEGTKTSKTPTKDIG